MQENSLGSDVSLKNLDRIVSSFAMQLKYAEDPNLDFSFSGSSQNSEVMPEDLDDFPDNGFKNLKNTFKDLGIGMIELGLQLAQVCDRAIGGKELEQSILDSCTAKGRLRHYHSSLDNLFLKDSEKTKSSIRRVTNLPVQLSIGFRELETKNMEQTLVDDLNRDTCETETRFCKTSLSKFWQQWHYDYDIFTVSQHQCSFHFVMNQRRDRTMETACHPSLNEKVMLSLIEEINGIVPPLSSRLKDGMTFTEFSCEATKQYNGGNGMQSKR
ncbi:hypothetical protein GIB67_015639 [Kingdonia uniflora]|uniref:Uncharacterized protein n=1 Tax=Kingdonia uniflora TaxID=39325 RepID=A0A7J7NU08_9MAGN|nr:hypothetical protein GIB67_015639 [Kingdonia uniflora]